LIVAAALRGIGEHLMGFRDALELFFGGAVSGMEIRMAFPREALVGLLDL
jgi:hypothetical protein